jgi:ElaB/YqjD/DUF883 family membrane-anchored ribosome-binding protein
MAATNQAALDGASTTYSAAKREIGDEIDALRNDIASLASTVSRLATEKAGSALGDTQAIAGEKLGELEKAIRDNPTQSAMIAVGVGFLVGLILNR